MGNRITLTNREFDSPLGRRLVDLILSICHDGEIELEELEELFSFLCESNSSIAAVGYLRAITRVILADGIVDGPDLYRLKKAFERVVPKSVRGVVSTHLEDIGTPSTEFYDTAPSWIWDDATVKQIDYIIVLGGIPSEGMTKGEASDLIENLLESRPPTLRQIMLLRFFDRLDLASSTKDEVSLWIDGIYDRHPRHEVAWERFKRQTNHDHRGQDYSIVPVGAYKDYMPSTGLLRGLFSLFFK